MKSLFLSQGTQLKEFKNYKIASYDLPFNDKVDSFQARLTFIYKYRHVQSKRLRRAYTDIYHRLYGGNLKRRNNGAL